MPWRTGAAMRKGIWAAAMMAALWAAPALADPTPPPPVGQAPGPARPTQDKNPLSVWRLTEDSYEHLQSGLRCPAEVGELRRVEITTYDVFGLDVSCGYNSRNTVITAYLTRGTGLDKAYEDAKASLLQHNEARHPALVSDARSQTDGLAWRRAVYAEAPDLQTDVWMTDLQGWIFEYRATYPAAAAAQTEAVLSQLTAQVRASAGARLDLCARSHPPDRPGRPIVDRAQTAQLGMVGALMGGAGEAAIEDGKAKAAEPVVFCVEDAAPGKEISFLTWRGVTPAGEDSHIDHVTPMTLGPPPVLVSTLDSLGNLIAGEAAHGKAPEHWVASLVADGKTTIYGYFDRRPSAKLLTPLMLDILTGKAKALGGYSADGKTINVTIPPK